MSKSCKGMLDAYLDCVEQSACVKARTQPRPSPPDALQAFLQRSTAYGRASHAATLHSPALARQVEGNTLAHCSKADSDVVPECKQKREARAHAHAPPRPPPCCSHAFPPFARALPPSPCASRGKRRRTTTATAAARRAAAQLYYFCKRGQVDMRTRIRGNPGY